MITSLKYIKPDIEVPQDIYLKNIRVKTLRMT